MLLSVLKRKLFASDGAVGYIESRFRELHSEADIVVGRITGK